MKTHVAALLLLVIAACTPAEQADKGAPESAESAESKTAAPPAQPAVDPAAVAALTRMSAYLRTLQSFEVHATTTMDQVLTDTEQKVQFAGNGIYRIRRPNAFYLESNTDRRQRQFYYDGTTFTIFSPRMDVYAQRPAPATIREMVTEMEERYAIPVPLSDLFYWGSEDLDTDFELASVIGFARMANQDADQYAFRQGDIDWQIWIARGDRPLPLKVVVTTRSDPAQPQFTSELAWNTNASFSPATFAFRAPNGAHQIQIAEAEAIRQQESQ
jgi:hypothetical protein